MNSVTLHGRLTRNPETKTTEKGTLTARFSVACDTQIKNAEGQFVPQTDFIGCVIYGKRAQTVETYFRKGSDILVRGRLHSYSYTGKDGAKKYGMDVVVEDFEFCGSARQKDDDSGPTEHSKAKSNGYAPESETVFDPLTGEDAEIPF